MHWPPDLKLILLPGLDGTGLLFEPLLNELPEECVTEIISYPLDQPQTFAQHVKYVSDRLPRNDPFVLLAESFSGPIAVEILASGLFPIERVIFVATFAKSPRSTLLRVTKYLPLLWLLNMDFPEVLIRYFCLGGKSPRGQIESFNSAIRKVGVEVIAQRLKILADVDTSAMLKKINVPCCYLQAIGDRLIPRGVLEVFVEGIAPLSVKKIDGPHFILQAEPKICAQAICAWLNGE